MQDNLENGGGEAPRDEVKGWLPEYAEHIQDILGERYATPNQGYEERGWLVRSDTVFYQGRRSNRYKKR